MIADYFIDCWQNLVGFVLSIFPSDFKVPDWLGGFLDFLSAQINNAANLGAWVPWPIVLAVVGGVLGYWLVLTAVKGVRWILNWIPTWGGS